MSARLTFVCSALVIGGAERSWVSLLPGLRDRGFDVQALTLIGEGPFFHELRARGIPATCAGMRRRTDLAGLRRASRVVRAGTDLLVSQNVNAQAVGVLLAKRARVPHVTVDHTPPGVSLRAYQRLLVRGVARNVELVIGVSSAQLPRFERLGFEEDRVVIIPNGIEELVPAVDRAATREQLELAEDDFVAVLVADLRPQKQAHVFVDAVRSAHARNPRVKGLVVGAGPEYERVAAAAARSGGAVTMLGARLDVPELMQAADVVCLSSASEGLPYALLEAMSLARPIVATAVDGITDAVVPEETGLLVPPQDSEAFAAALLRAAADRELVRRLGAAGRARQQERFSAGGMADAYARAVTGVLSARGRRRPDG